MIVYLAVSQLKSSYDILHGADILSSFYYCRNNNKMIAAIPRMRDFLLDSGVFTFINSKTRVDMESYVREYAEFVKANNIKSYVELDVDQIKGVRETRKLRDKLESLVGWQSIPVWHTIRGVDSFISDCKEYDRICLGFFLTEGLSTQTTEKYAPYLIGKAHEHDCKIHGLGFTKTTLLPRYHFDSVDSSTWSLGKRYGAVSYFDPNEKCIKQITRPKNKRISSYLAIETFNFNQWRLYQDYARNNLQVITR